MASTPDNMLNKLHNMQNELKKIITNLHKILDAQPSSSSDKLERERDIKSGLTRLLNYLTISDSDGDDTEDGKKPSTGCDDHPGETGRALLKLCYELTYMCIYVQFSQFSSELRELFSHARSKMYIDACCDISRIEYTNLETLLHRTQARYESKCPYRDNTCRGSVCHCYIDPRESIIMNNVIEYSRENFLPFPVFDTVRQSCAEIGIQLPQMPEMP